MSKTLKKCLAMFLSATLLLCTLGIQSFAVDENGLIIGKKDNTFETAIEVTGDFTATINEMVSYYKFTPAESGYYRVSDDTEVLVAYLEVYDSELNTLGYGDGSSFWQSVSDTDFDAFLNLTEGEPYYFEIGLTYDAIILDNSVSFDVSVDFLGSITGASLVSPPDKLTYIQGIDEEGYTSPDSLYYGFNFDITGAFADVTFSQGQTVTLCDYTIEEIFERSYDSEKRHLGENTVYFKLGETVMFSFVITLIENPVESIEIVRLPDKTDYTYGIDGVIEYGDFYPEIDLTGLQVKINYKGGTSKTVDWTNAEDDRMLVDGYPIFVDCYGVYEPGEASVYVYYLANEAEFNTNFDSPTFFEKLTILFSTEYLGTLEYLSAFFYLPLYLFYAPVNFFTALFNLIKM